LPYCQALERPGEFDLPLALRVIAGFSPLLLLIACGGNHEATTAAADEVHPVRVMTVKRDDMMRTLNAVGTVRYRRETALGFTSPGKVAVVRFDEGDFVKRGTLLAALDATVVGADMSVASAERDRTRADLERIRALYHDGWVTKARFEAAEAAAQSAQARVRQAGFATGNAQLHAPSSGVILSRNVEPGQVISAGTPVMTIGENDEGFVFRAPIVERDAARLRVGMAADIMIESLDGAPISATITEIDGRANEATGAFNVQFRLDNRPQLRSGQIGTAAIKLPAAANGALQIPASALFGVRTGEGLVFVVDGKNRVETRNVAIERVADDFVIVTGGIKPGDVIVMSGGEKLRAGAKVRVVKAP
jgi:RND family efflux transporter MFP subunit